MRELLGEPIHVARTRAPLWRFRDPEPRNRPLRRQSGAGDRNSNPRPPTLAKGIPAISFIRWTGRRIFVEDRYCQLICGLPCMRAPSQAGSTRRRSRSNFEQARCGATAWCIASRRTTAFGRFARGGGRGQLVEGSFHTYASQPSIEGGSVCSAALR